MNGQDMIPGFRPLCHCGQYMLRIAGSDNYFFCRDCDQPAAICPKTRTGSCR